MAPSKKAMDLKKFKNPEYCQKYRHKNLAKIQQTDKDRKRLARDVKKYLEPEKYEAALLKDRERKRKGKHFLVVAVIDLLPRLSF